MCIELAGLWCGDPVGEMYASSLPMLRAITAISLSSESCVHSPTPQLYRQFLLPVEGNVIRNHLLLSILSLTVGLLILTQKERESQLSFRAIYKYICIYCRKCWWVEQTTSGRSRTTRMTSSAPFFLEFPILRFNTLQVHKYTYVHIYIYMQYWFRHIPCLYCSETLKQVVRGTFRAIIACEIAVISWNYIYATVYYVRKFLNPLNYSIGLVGGDE